MAYVEKFYIDAETDELIIITDFGDGSQSVAKASCIGEIEHEDEEEAPAGDEEKPKRTYKKRERFDGIGEAELHIPTKEKRVQFRLKAGEAAMVSDYLEDGMNSKEIAQRMSWTQEKANSIIDRLRGADMELKIKEPEGLSL